MDTISTQPGDIPHTDDLQTTDGGWRKRIGPWEKDELPPLDIFEPDTNFVVRAAAGSGKTTALVARMVGLIRVGAAMPSEMAAITFTRKAAGEMEGRFYKELQQTRRLLEKREEVSEGSDEKANVNNALAEVQECFIGTIHAFCGRILREHALEIGLPPGFSAGLEDEEEETLRQQVWADYIQQLHTPDDSDSKKQLDRLTEYGLRPSDLVDLFGTASRYPELDLYTNRPETPPDLSSAVEEAKRVVRAWHPKIPSDPLEERDGAQKALDRAAGMLRHKSLESPAEQARFLTILDDAYKDSKEQGNVTLKAWGESSTPEREEAHKLRDEVFPQLIATIRPSLHAWQACAHHEAVQFVQPAAERYLKVRREQGRLTHHDVLYFTRELLRTRPEVRRQVQERTPRLLVDEFQDTDPLMAEILFYLTGENVEEKDWTQCRPLPGRLFIVGDDKQSIYRFRRADITVFNQVAELVEKYGGERAELTKNYRSHAPICDFCNEAFEVLYSEPGVAAEAQAKYVSLQPQNTKVRDTTSIRLLQTGKVNRNNAKKIAPKDAAQIARFIREAVDAGRAHDMAGDEEDERVIFPGGASYDDFLILTRKKKRLSIYAEALAQQGIPFTVTGSEDLGDSDELKALVDVLSCALRPDDPVAALAYLKGPLAGLSDDDLYQYRRSVSDVAGWYRPFAMMHRPIPEEVVETLPDELAERLTTAFRRVRSVRETVRRNRPVVALSRVAEEAGLMAAAAHPDDANERSMRAGRFVRALTLVRERAGDGLDWAEIVAELHDVVYGDKALDSLTLESGAGNAVRLMNLHQAKGLEAPVVFLADPYSPSGGSHSPTKHVHRQSPDSTNDVQLVVPITRPNQYNETITHAPLGWRDNEVKNQTMGFASIEEMYEEAESKRLLYVAATRAERLLVVSQYCDKDGTPKKGVWGDLHAFLPEETPVLHPASTASTGVMLDRCSAPNLEAVFSLRDTAIERVQKPSYEEDTVTSQEKSVASLGPGRAFGRFFGVVVHQLLDTYVTRSFADEVMSASHIRKRFELARESEETRRHAGEKLDVPDTITDTMVDDARRILREFSASEVAKAVRNAEHVLTEYPYAEAETSGRSREADESCIITRGTIDLVYRDAAGWHIIDYKTDRIDTSIELEQALKGHDYVEQVTQYAKAWKRLTGESVVSYGLWFGNNKTIHLSA